jgi:DtxR family Mn-dependent transcriptional regulator
MLLGESYIMSDEEISGKAEDYLRTIHEVVRRKGFARIKNIALILEVKPPTVVEMMKKLAARGLVVYEKYGGVTLTAHGKRIAEVVEKRHETFRKFLEILLVPKDIALKDAHILEHQLHPNTVLQFSRFVDFITRYSERPMFMKRWLLEFKKYCERNGVEGNQE